jgi:hypothetical protein
MSAEKLFEALKENRLIGARGQVFFEMNNIKTQVYDNSVIGNIIQEWLLSFMKEKGIYFRRPENSQEFPDYFMNEKSDLTDLLEVKCFKKSPNFDVANFSAYCRSIVSHPYRLDANYLIIEYIPDKEGVIIKNIWLKKVWEICSASERASLKIQWKQNQPFNIRPSTWYAQKPKYVSFKTRRDFVMAVKTVLDVSQFGGDWRKNWFKTVETKYFEQTGLDL